MKKYIQIILVLVTYSCYSQIKEISIKKLENELDSLIEITMIEERIPGASFIIVKDGKTLLKKGYGFTTLGENLAYVNPDSTIFRIGSITKTFTALALLQQIDKNKIKIDEDVNNHLSSIKVLDTFKEPITPFHLLTHSAGFDEIGGRRVFENSEQIELSKFLDKNLVRIRKPEIVSAYSSYGIALAGLIVGELSGISLNNYMKLNIWNPLGMTKTSFELSDNNRSNLSFGYEIYKGVNIPQPWEYYHTFPASSINSTVADMGKYMKMLLNNGKCNGKQILSKKYIQSMLTQQLSIHPEAHGFTYGFYEKHQYGLKAYSHGGDMLGYSSLITLIPEINLGVFVVHHHENTSLRNKVISKVLEHFGSKNKIDDNPKKLNKNLSQFVGYYKWMSTCYTCENGKKTQKYQLSLNSEDNTLIGFGRKFYQVSDLLFKSYDGQRIMGFTRDEDNKIKYMSLGNVNAFEKID